MSQRLAAAAAVAVLIAAPLAAQTASRIAPEAAPSVASVVPGGEPGVPLRVEGVVRGADGQPVAGASIYVYQTDARGYYHPDDAMGNRNPRLFALLRSDAAGRYAFTTVRPGPYPRGGVQAHIHYEVRGAGHADRVFELVFDDDPLVGERIRSQAARPGSFFAIRAVEPGAGGGPGRVQLDVLLTR
jgi:protocatechuate 3,4-dioxygenase beta subunit